LIGLNDIPREGRFEWSDDTTFGYENWSRNQPAIDGAEQDCVAIDTKTYFQWADTECKFPYSYVCKREKIVEPSSESENETFDSNEACVSE
jgi:hypothetical protein